MENTTVESGKPVYQIHALQYATLPAFPKSLIVYGVGFDEMIENFPFYFWVVEGNGKKICVDCGYAADGWAEENFGMINYQSPKEVLAKINLTPEEITDVIITHIHWDHAGNIPAFPNAKVWIQSDELEFAAGQGTEYKIASEHIRPKHVKDLLDAKKAGHLNIVNGDQTIFPGIDAYKLPEAHTHSAQFLVVNTPSRPVVLASDIIYLYENLETETPNGIGLSLIGMEAGIKMVKKYSDDLDYIIPGHDRLVLEKFERVADGAAKIA